MKAMIANGSEFLYRVSDFEQNRDKLLKRISSCSSPMSPRNRRCLLESLVCGTPIVAIQSSYAQDLVKDFGGGIFVPMEDGNNSAIL